MIDNRAVGVACYSPAYTFVEKLQTVSTKFRLQQDAVSFPKNFLRHYYDLYCLLESPEVQAFIGTPAYHARKKERFRAGDNLHIASNEAFLLSDRAVRDLYDSKYRETAALYYAGQVHETTGILALLRAKEAPRRRRHQKKIQPITQQRRSLTISCGCRFPIQ